MNCFLNRESVEHEHKLSLKSHHLKVPLPYFSFLVTMLQFHALTMQSASQWTNQMDFVGTKCRASTWFEHFENQTRNQLKQQCNNHDLERNHLELQDYHAKFFKSHNLGNKFQAAILVFNVLDSTQAISVRIKLKFQVLRVALQSALQVFLKH